MKWLVRLLKKLHFVVSLPLGSSSTNEKRNATRITIARDTQHTHKTIYCWFIARRGRNGLWIDLIDSESFSKSILAADERQGMAWLLIFARPPRQPFGRCWLIASSLPVEYAKTTQLWVRFRIVKLSSLPGNIDLPTFSDPTRPGILSNRQLVSSYKTTRVHQRHQGNACPRTEISCQPIGKRYAYRVAYLTGFKAGQLLPRRVCDALVHFDGIIIVAFTSLFFSHIYGIDIFSASMCVCWYEAWMGGNERNARTSLLSRSTILLVAQSHSPRYQGDEM